MPFRSSWASSTQGRWSMRVWARVSASRDDWAGDPNSVSAAVAAMGQWRAVHTAWPLRSTGIRAVVQCKRKCTWSLATVYRYP